MTVDKKKMEKGKAFSYIFAGVPYATSVPLTSTITHMRSLGFSLLLAHWLVGFLVLLSSGKF